MLGNKYRVLLFVHKLAPYGRLNIVCKNLLTLVPFSLLNDNKHLKQPTTSLQLKISICNTYIPILCGVPLMMAFGIYRLFQSRLLLTCQNSLYDSAGTSGTVSVTADNRSKQREFPVPSM